MKCSISTYYKILDAELYNYDDGYMKLDVDVNAKSIDLEEYLFLFYGTLRASTLLPTVMTLKGVRLNAKGIIAGVVTALAVGLPVFAYGSVLNSGPYKTLGSLLTVLLSGIIALAASGKERRYAR